MIAPGRTLLPASPGSRWLLNLVGFQVAWLATVLGAAHGLGWLGPAAVAVVVALHMGLSARVGAEGRLLVLALLLGIGVEHALLWAGLIRYTGDPAWVPVWMLALWPLLATTLNVSLGWLKTRLWLAAAFGALAGPLAYRGGAALGAIELPDAGVSVTALALIWAAAFPALLLAARRSSDPLRPVGRA